MAQTWLPSPGGPLVKSCLGSPGGPLLRAACQPSMAQIASALHCAWLALREAAAASVAVPRPLFVKQGHCCLCLRRCTARHLHGWSGLGVVLVAQPASDGLGQPAKQCWQETASCCLVNSLCHAAQALEVTPWLQDRGEDRHEGYHLDRILVPIGSLSGWAIVLVGILASLQVGAA